MKTTNQSKHCVSTEIPISIHLNSDINQEILDKIQNGSFYGIKTNDALVIGVKLKDGKDAVITVK